MNVEHLVLPAAFCGATPVAIHGDSLASLLTAWSSAAKLRNAAPGDQVAQPTAKAPAYAVDANGVATIPMQGVMLGEADPFLDWLGVAYTITPQLTQAITDANGRADVKAIVIDANSPGGSVTGLQAAFDAIAASGKPVMVAASDLLCSAALYVASAADQIIADPTTIVGSIGTMTTITDMSKLAERIGIQVHLIASGPQKGTGTPGVPVTDERKRPMQAIVDQLAAQFKSAVATGRKLDPAHVDRIATGEAWLAARAAEHGLVDAITTNPLAAAGATARERLMLTKDQLKALHKAHPEHAALINQMDDDGKDEADVKAAIVEAKQKAQGERLAALEAENAKLKADHAAALKAEQDAHAKTKADLEAMTAKHDKLAKLAPNHGDVGAGPLRQADSVAKPDPLTQAQFDALPSQSARAAFMAAGGEIVG